VLALPALLMLSACQLSLIPRQDRPADAEVVEVPAASPACVKLNTKVLALTGTSIGLITLSSGSGVTSLLTTSVPRYVVGAVGLGLGLGTGVTTYLSTAFSATFTRECTNNGGN
jgi:hypothetical protein